MAIFVEASIFVLSLAQILTVITAAGILPFPTPPERDVSSMCAATLCSVGTVCRVVKACSHERCFTFATCIPCVPDGADAICNANDYIYTVLMVKPKQVSSMSRFTPLFCDPTLDNAVSGCPLGSVCAASEQSRSIGTCCYGKPDFPTPSVATPPTGINTDPICDTPSDLCGEKCPQGTKCQPTKKDCGELVYSCRPIAKPGRCPPLPYSPPDLCKAVRVGYFCDTDSDCKDDKKCCKTVCGGRACLSPF